MCMKTHGMKSLPLQQNDPCKDCPTRKNAEQEILQTNDVAQPNLADYRQTCANCQRIYKFDLLMQYWKTQKRTQLPKGKGRRCVIPDYIQNKVLEHHQNGMTQQEIADKVGVSRSQVQRIIERLTP